MAVLGNALKHTLAQAGLRLVTRAEWNARPRRHLTQIALPSRELWVHHTADDRQGVSIRAHQDFHMDVRGWSDIAYTLLVDNGGVVYEGRGIGVAGGHTRGRNTISHAICLLGNFEGRQPTDASVDTLVKLARLGRDRGWWIPTLGGHRDADRMLPPDQRTGTVCPGQHLYDRLPEIRTRVANPPEDDMTPEQARQLLSVYKAVIHGRRHVTDGPDTTGVFTHTIFNRAKGADNKSAKSVAQNAAILEAVNQLAGGSTVIDYDQVQQRAEAALRDVLGSLGDDE